MKRLIIWGLVLCLIGATAGFVFGAGVGRPHDYGPTLVVPAPRIIEREVPGPTKIRTRIVYKYVQADVTARAPGGAESDVAAFCKPVVAKIQGDTAAARTAPQSELVRSLTAHSPWLWWRPASLVVTSETNRGDLYARDYRTGIDFGVGSGDSILVRSPRLEPVKRLGKSLLDYAFWRLVEFGVSSAIHRAPGSSYNPG